MRVLYGMAAIMLLLGCSTHMKNVIIDSDPAFFGPEEPSICVNPTNTKNIIAGANIRRAYYSKDAGKTWIHTEIESTYGVYGDPCIVADPNSGHVYYLHLSDPEGKGWASERLLDRIVCQRSEDGGKSYNNGGYMGYHESDRPDQDKEWAVVNPFNSEVYTTWTHFDHYNSKELGDSSHIMFAKSSDGGETWSEALRISQYAGNCLDNDSTVEGAVPAVGPNGEIYVAWSYGDEIYFDRSEDGGKSWLANDVVVTTGTGGWNIDVPGMNRTNGMPVTMCDLSGGSHHGRIYINWCDTRNGESNTDIWMVYSDDKGTTWSAPIRVNDDKTKRHQYLTWMSVDQKTGVVYCVFYDRRNYEDNSTDVYLAYSKDGGKTFKNIKISEKSFTPKEFIFFGDYNNISAHDDVVRPIWTRLDTSTLSIWTCLINGNKLE